MRIRWDRQQDALLRSLLDSDIYIKGEAGTAPSVEKRDFIYSICALLHLLATRYSGPQHPSWHTRQSHPIPLDFVELVVRLAESQVCCSTGTGGRTVRTFSGLQLQFYMKAVLAATFAPEQSLPFYRAVAVQHMLFASAWRI